MARKYTNRSVSRDQIRPELFDLPMWTHPEVLYWFSDWKMIRDCTAGERAIKAEREAYLPRFASMDGEEYDSYLERATFYNFTGRTIKAMVGSVMRRTHVIEGMPDRLAPRLDSISQTNGDFKSFAKLVCTELLTLGRVGVLVDLPEQMSTEPLPYLTAYTAENIIDWDVSTNPQTGRQFLSRMVLREVHMQPAAGSSVTRKTKSTYRVLGLIDGVYRQTTHDEIAPSGALGPMTSAVIPVIRGEPLDHIPFHVFGPSASGVGAETPPLLDIAALNISHYQSYAHLEQGRFFTGFPVYFAEVGQGDSPGADYELAPNRVWEVATGTKPGLLEFNGQGLKFLENALDQKEQQAASLGGRMIGVRAAATTESDNQLKLKERNEQAILLDIAMSMDRGFTSVLREWAAMAGTAAPDLTIEFNKDFLFDGIGAREFRAIQSMYMDGIIPIDVVYSYLHKAGVIPDHMRQDEFERLLTKMTAFPNQPDAQARAEGYPNAQARLTEEQKQLDREAEQELLDTELEADAEQADKARKSAEKVAKSQPKVAPVAAKPGAPAAAPAAAKKPPAR